MTHSFPLRLAFAGIVAALVLSACGEQFVSAAAVVNGKEITVEDLKRQVDAGLASSTAPTQEETANFSREVLTFLIQVEIASEYAREHDITVTSQDVDEQLQNLASRFGGQEQLTKVLAEQGLTLAQVRENAEMRVLLAKVGRAVVGSTSGGTPTAPGSSGAAFREWLTERMAAARIEVNPRYGRLDRSTGSIVPITSTADLP